ncbi:MAG TPA: hypothetical protein VEB20_15890 [Azospirillaceae bacterium]|nr:hypothetical protein [Azospirillaceae bacterium]
MTALKRISLLAWSVARTVFATGGQFDPARLSQHALRDLGLHCCRPGYR